MSGGHETIIVEKRGQVDWVTLNRPERLNAITETMTRELGGYFDGLFSDPSVRIVVLRGGQVVEEGPAEEVIARPREDYTRALMAAAFSLEADESGIVAS